MPSDGTQLAPSFRLSWDTGLPDGFSYIQGRFSSLISASEGKPSEALLEVPPVDSADTMTLRNKSRLFNIIAHSLLTGV